MSVILTRGLAGKRPKRSGIPPTYQSLASAGLAGVTSSATVNYPSTKTAGHVVIATLAIKPHTITPTNIGGAWSPWVSRAGGDAADPHGVDSGRTLTGVCWKTLTGSEGASESATLSGSADPWITNMLRYSGVDPTVIASTSGNDSADGTGVGAYTAVMDSDPGFAVGDKAVVVMSRPVDAGTFNTPALAIPGCTVAAGDYRITAFSATGSDGYLIAIDFNISTGVSTGVATYSETIVSATTLGAGPAVLIRLRGV